MSCRRVLSSTPLLARGSETGGDLQLALWNTKGLIQHTELKTFISIHTIHNIYRTTLKSIWTYEIQLWGTASTSNIEILEHFQSKDLRMIVDAPWYVPNMVIRRDLQTPRVKEEIHHYNSQYSAPISTHPNNLLVNLMELPDNRRLWRQLPNDLSTRFLV
jgi:hypothetical protein